MIRPSLIAKADALETLMQENRSRYDFDKIVVEWLLARGYAEKIEGETEEDFGLSITDKGRARFTGKLEHSETNLQQLGIKWPDDEACRIKNIARAIFVERCSHNRSRLEVDNCGKCQLTSGDEDGPNYAGWARLYIEAGRTIPEKWRGAFQRELDSDNRAYANALRRSIATFGEPRFV